MPSAKEKNQTDPLADTVGEGDTDKPEGEPTPPVVAAAAATTKTVTPPVVPADWAQMACDQAPVIRYPTDVAGPEIWDANETDTIMLVGTSGQKITHLGSDFSSTLHPQLARLILRSHLIADMKGLGSFRALKLLELYDNQIEELVGLDSAFGKTLTVLDMSYNVIRDMSPVQFCPNLTELYLANNKIKSIEGLSGLSQLVKLDLGANRIRTIPPEELAGLTSLTELWLGKNKIESMQGLEALVTKTLRRLDLQSNRLTRIDILPEHLQETLEEFYLADNGIDTEGLAGLQAVTLPKINVLDLSKNRVTECSPLSHLVTLEELWLSGNLVDSWGQVETLTALVNLETIYLEYNPIASSDPLYRKSLAEFFQSGKLRQIDADPIGPTGRAGGGTAVDRAEELRRLQDIVVEKARRETQDAKEKEASS
mmetsp:Transcript_4836/g.9939  ORF Transcript_4836/g.9939 Transcript_4836/m.9939 type:complete len:426 (-) Transcript_4836:192-1469(-)